MNACLGVANMAGNVFYLNGPAFWEKTTRLAHLCEELQSYLWNNRSALIDYGRRRREGKPISTAGAEGTVNQLVNARLNRGGQMRWSARGAQPTASCRCEPPSLTAACTQKRSRRPRRHPQLFYSPVLPLPFHH